MLAAVRSAAVLGIDAYDVLVEVDVAPGLPIWTIVGLTGGSGARKAASASVPRSLNSGFVVPSRRTTINLAPGDQRKDGNRVRSPDRVRLPRRDGSDSMRTRSRRSSPSASSGLDGTLRPVRGTLSVARRARRVRGRRTAPPPSEVTLVLPPPNVARGIARLETVALARRRH